MKTEERIKEVLQKCYSIIADNMARADRIATGGTLAAMHIEVSATAERVSGALWVPYWFERIEGGTSPEEAEKEADFANKIVKWAEARKIDDEDRVIRIIGNILEHGTYIYQGGEPEDVFTSDIEAYLAEVSQTLTADIANNISNALLSAIDYNGSAVKAFDLFND